MRHNYNLDRLIEYSLDPIPDPTKVVNPAYRSLDKQVRNNKAKQRRLFSEFGKIQLHDEIEPAEVEKYQTKKADLQEEIQNLQIEVVKLKQQRKKVPRHITISELPEAEKFDALSSASKYLLDTIKMVAYRAETAMVNIIRKTMSRPDDGRKLLKAIYSTEADILPDEKNGTLTVNLHHLTNHC